MSRSGAKLITKWIAYPHLICFFFQAEDGIRDTSVTGVQTCALPIFVVLRLQVEGIGLHPNIDVFADEDHGGAVALGLQLQGQRDHLVVGLARIEVVRELSGTVVGQLDAQRATVLEGDPLGELSLGAKLVEIMGDEPGVPPDLVLPALLAVDRLDRRQGHPDLVVLEGVDRVRIVQQDVGIENVDLLHACTLRGTDEVAYSPWYSNGSSWAIFVIR